MRNRGGEHRVHPPNLGVCDRSGRAASPSAWSVSASSSTRPPRSATSASTRSGAATAHGSATSGWPRPTARRSPTPTSPRATSCPAARRWCSPTRTSPTCRCPARASSTSCSSCRSSRSTRSTSTRATTSSRRRTAVKPYVLLRDALEESETAALVKVAIRNREQLATLRVRDGVIVLETMIWPDEVREPDFGFLDEDIDLRPQEQAMARSLVESMAGDFDPTQYTDDYREALQAVIDAKIEGREVVETEEAQPNAGNVVDLMSALRASVEAAKQGRGEAGAAAEAGRVEERRRRSRRRRAGEEGGRQEGGAGQEGGGRRRRPRRPRRRRRRRRRRRPAKKAAGEEGGRPGRAPDRVATYGGGMPKPPSREAPTARLSDADLLPVGRRRCTSWPGRTSRSASSRAARPHDAQRQPRRRAGAVRARPRRLGAQLDRPRRRAARPPRRRGDRPARVRAVRPGRRQRLHTRRARRRGHRLPRAVRPRAGASRSATRWAARSSSWSRRGAPTWSAP